MASPQAPRCRRTSSLSEAEAEAKDSADEYMGPDSPDILHVFREDKAETSAGPLTARVSNSPVASENSPSSFPQFRRLPVELRYLIWEAAVPEPTVVPRTWNNSNFRYNLQRSVPAVLQACAESRGLLVPQPGAGRRVAATTTTTAAVPKYELVQTRGREDEGVYMDFDKDSIWVYRGCEYCCCPPFPPKPPRGWWTVDPPLHLPEGTAMLIPHDRRHKRRRGRSVRQPAQPRHELGPAAVLGRLGGGRWRRVRAQVPGAPAADAAGRLQRARLARPLDAQGAQEAEAHRGQAHMGPRAGGVPEGRGGRPRLDGAAPAYRTPDGQLVSEGGEVRGVF